jgi:hypothetical protein
MRSRVLLRRAGVDGNPSPSGTILLMKDSDIREYATRDWTIAENLKLEYWSSRKRTMTPAEAIAISEELRRYVESVRPDFPRDESREADLEVHRRVSEALRSVATRRS